MYNRHRLSWEFVQCARDVKYVAVVVASIAALVGFGFLCRANQLATQIAISSAHLKKHANMPLDAAAPGTIDKSPNKSFASIGIENSIVISLSILAQQSNISMEHGDYELIASSTPEIKFYRLNFPIRGSYLAIRKFIAQAMHENPNLALDRISFERANAEDAVVVANVVMTLILSDRS